MLNIINTLQKKSFSDPTKIAYLFLPDGQSENGSLSFSELDQRARKIAVYLQKQNLAGERIMLMLPPGLDFIVSFMGTLYAGAIAVPVNCPKPDEFSYAAAQLTAIADDADIAGIITSSACLNGAEESFSQWRETKKIFVKDITAFNTEEIAAYHPPEINNNSIAYLQYTSGSTSKPKAAIVTHANLTHSLKHTADVWNYQKDSVTLVWAPHTHVYGLICGLLVPLYHGTQSIIMPPAAFVQKPTRWLQAISKYRVTHSGCPNFGYDLCIKNIQPEEIDNLDLSCWHVAINGGENVKAETLRKFVEKFQPHGFHLQQFNSAFGMSEVTGAIAVSTYASAPQIINVDGEALTNNEIKVSNKNMTQREFVMNGRLLPGLAVMIVNPETNQPLDENKVGEIWLRGKSVVSGYWRRPEETKAVFTVYPGSRQKYFRTGDLGFIRNGELCLTGRLKEIMVINGKKHYPLDLENTIAAAHNSANNGARVVFSLQIDNKEEVIVVQEIEKTLSASIQEELLVAIRHAIAKHHGITLHHVLLVPNGTIPKTNSGKLQRKRAQTNYQENQLPIIHEYKTGTITTAITGTADTVKFAGIVAEVLSLSVDKIDMRAPLSHYQFDSINMIKLTAALNETYQLDLSPAILYEYSSLEAFFQSRLNHNVKATHVISSAAATRATDIAIVGMSGIFPQANNLAEFWQNLISGADAITPIPTDRWDWQAYYGDPKTERNKTNIKWGGFIHEIAQFDAKFFNISPHEAELMDPQQRLFLTVAWQAIEDAGYSTSSLAKLKTGLFVGAFNHDYAEILQRNDMMDAYITTGLTPSIIANRISFILDLHGPSEVIDTACSSSLVAIHHAVRAIQNGDCEAAIVGGVNALLTPTSYISASKAGMLCLDGRCKTFDKNANGYVRGEGIAALVLKPLTAAIADHDHIYAVIKGTAVNHGGHVNSLTVPNPNAQSDVIISALERANVAIDTIDYIEAHGTGTALGDPIEINGLKKAFAHCAQKQNITNLATHYCGIGSVKTNIGHLESAAGIAGLIKVILAMQNETLPANLHFQELNPYIDIAESPFYIVNQAKKWPRRGKDRLRRAGVSSFGFGGTNAHIVIEDAPDISAHVTNDISPSLITISAKDERGLQQRISDLKTWLQQHGNQVTLASLAYTLNAGRDHFKQRCVIVANSIDSFIAALEKVQPGVIYNADTIAASSHDLIRLAQDYINGEDIDWETALTYQYKQRISLPPYPFATDKFWINGHHQSVIQKKQYHAQDYFIRDHLIRNSAIIPAAAYIDLVAMKSATQITELIFYKPIAMSGKQIELDLKLTTKETQTSFSIQVGQEIFAEGKVTSSPPAESIEVIDFAKIKRRLNQYIDQSEFYASFKKAGIIYGDSMQALQEAHFDQHELVAFLSAPDRQICLLDGILHATTLLLDNEDGLFVPFSIKQIDIYAALPHECYVYATRINDNRDSVLPRFMIKVLDTTGRVLINIQEFSVHPYNIYYYQPSWQTAPLSGTQSLTNKTIVIFDSAGDTAETLRNSNNRVIHIDHENDYNKITEYLPDYYLIKHDNCSENICSHSFQILKQTTSLAKAILAKRPDKQIHLVNIINAECQLSTALAAFAKSLRQENPQLIARVITSNNVDHILPELSATDVEVNYTLDNIRKVKRYESIAADKIDYTPKEIKKSGVYLITGGLGGIGWLFAEYLASKFQANLILTGRSTPNTTQLNAIRDLEQHGGKVLYIQADVSQKADVESLTAETLRHFGTLNGILHAAGVTHDEFIFNKPIENLQKVLAPKINGAYYLDEATKDLNLDFFALFSSVASVFGNAGQCDYAFANGLLDTFATQRNGKTIAINWPLWKEGGMRIHAAAQQQLADKLGITTLTTMDGIAAFHAALGTGLSNIIVLPGNKTRLQQTLHQRAAGVRIADEISQTSETSYDLTATNADYLRDIISTSVKIPAHQIALKDEFASYGIDSVMIINLNHQLEKIFGDLPKTLFFEYKNLAELRDYFLKHHTQTLLKVLPQQTIYTQQVKQQAEPTQEKIYKQDHSSPYDIAIIGVSGRYPQAENLATYWENLRSGKNCITEIPADRWDMEMYFDADKNQHGKSYSKWGGFIADADKFDSLFFNISPREAEQMDPQERIFLETAWHTLEDAGYAAEEFAGKKIGVFVGAMYSQYQLFSASAESNILTNSFFASIANRVSYFLNLHGPSIALDTMCSSSLTAIHLACKSIINGECESAIAGGVNLSIHPHKYLLLSQGNFLATDGHCRSFGADGDGYVPGEGTGAVLLKPLHLALRDGDHIYGIIKGSSINHGGKTNGYTVPNPSAQTTVIQDAYNQSAIDPATVSYIEAHGTGTALGDPIEIVGLSNVFKTGHYSIGSVKSNIGHCESAAGIAAVTKVLLQMQHKTLVPSLHAESLNQNIDWKTSVFRVQTQLEEWRQPGINIPRRAGISSFGAGGSNAHIIIEEAQQHKPVIANNKPCYLFALSAKTEAALQQRIKDLATWLPEQVTLADVSFSLNAGRKHFDHRAIVCAGTLSELKDGLQSLLAGNNSANCFINLTATKQNEGIFAKIIADITNNLANATAANYRDNLLALAKFYCDGHTLDWQQLHVNETRRRISLPGYPFARERFWYQDTQETVMSEAQIITEQTPLTTLVSHKLTQIICAQLKLEPGKFDVNRNVSEYGVDSVTFIAIIKSINTFYQLDLTPAIFYLHTNVSNVSHYLVNDFHDATHSAHAQQIQTQPRQAVTMPTKRSSHPVHTIKSAREDQAVAIIGMQGIFPQSADAQTFWANLLAGNDLVSEVPVERWNWRDHYGDTKTEKNKSNSRWGGFINDPDKFDAAFFNISAREANLMDPQQRLFLEIAWKTIEDAGYNPESFAGESVGVFAGVEFSEYQTLIANQGREFHGYIATGNSHSLLANRVSYFLNLHGPSEAVDTACSSSLVAIHRAINAIRADECQLAIAGGVSLLLNPDTLIITSQLGALSPDGRCKTFDKSANGYVKGEGVAAILLKPLRQALADGDHIYAVIRGSAVNHGGKAQSLTAPNAMAQSELLLKAYAQSNINPESISYIETHGTGTELGDPVEIEGLKLAFKQLLPASSNTRIGLGSVKTSIGHLEPASGIASVVKVILAMQHEVIPGNLHFCELNPYIALTDTPFYLFNETTAWPKNKEKRRAGISSFGFGGTNAHIVLEEAPARSIDAAQHKPYYLFALSAKTEDSLRQKITDLHAWLQKQSVVAIEALSYTLNAGRAHFDYRCALLAASANELIEILSDTNSQRIMFSDKAVKASGPIFDEIYRIAVAALANTSDRNTYYDKLVLVADLYLKYYPIAWETLHAGENQMRIAGLPVYPFVKTRHWFETAVQPVVEMQISTESAPVQDLKTATLLYLRKVFAGKLAIAPEQIDYDETYEVYGVDSLTGLEITNKLAEDFGDVSKTLLYERNNLRDLAGFFLKNHESRLGELVGIISPLTRHAEKQELRALTPPSKGEVTLRSEDIAIVGLNIVLPQANNLDEFWNNLATGKDCITEVPADRWNYKDYPVTLGTEEKYFKYGGFIEHTDKFDALFFNISPRDAALMDPQERLFLQSAWAALEDGGHTREKLRRTINNQIGVFAGATYNYYPIFIAEEWHKGNRVPMDIQMFSIANRISYFLNATGPSYVIDTACSSSLGAIHLACESILRGECQMAIAGGVNLTLHPAKYHFLGSFSFMSDEGRCASFAEGGNGYVPSEGVGTVVLKPLSLALRDHDRIYGVIKASSMNHGGKTSGYTVPNPNAQRDVISLALNKSNIDPRTISYVEAHGTGTSLGDPIEIRGLEEAYGEYTSDKQYCAIGSVKSNIGHCESAAGISQLAKVLLQLQHKQLAPSIHAEKLNPYINFTQSPFYVQRELTDWKCAPGQSRRAGISSFGAGGTNVHVIVEEYNTVVQANNYDRDMPFIFVLSAQNHERLHEYAQLMHEHFSRHTNSAEWLRMACYTLQTGREPMSARLAITGVTAQDILAKLKEYLQQPETWSNKNSAQPSQQKPDIAAFISARSYNELVHHWLLGATVAWDKLYQHQQSCVALPTYPYARRRCWITTKAVEKTLPAPETKSVSPAVDVNDWLYQLRWERTEQTAIPRELEANERWLIFSDTELGFVLGDELGMEHCIYCFVSENDNEFRGQHSENVYYVNSKCEEDYDNLFRQIHARDNTNLKGIIYLCPFTSLTAGTATTAAESLLILQQQLIKHEWSNKILFCLATRGAQVVMKDEQMTQWNHHLWSLTRIFASEQNAYNALLLDMDSTVNLRTDAKIIMREILSYRPEINHTAYRHAQKYTLQMSRYPQSSSAQSAKIPTSALITGGLGALGLETATWLVKQGCKYLLLTGSSTLPPRDTWSQINDQVLKEKINGMIELEKTGAQVVYAAVDVTDKDAMRYIIDDFETKTRRKIDGVMHLAGVTTDNIPIAQLDIATLNKVLKVKLTGSVVLHELFSEQPLACFVLFSSIAAVPYFGMNGLSVYAMANEFMDGLAAYRRQKGLTATSINWIAWAEKGMSFRYHHGAFLAAVGMAELPIVDGLEILRFILSEPAANMIVGKITWETFMRINSTARHLDFFHEFASYGAKTKTNTIGHLNRQQILLTLINVFAATLELNFAEIDADNVFQNYGLDSIIGIKFIADLSAHFPDVLTAMDLYRYPTLNKLADFILSTQQSSTPEPTETEIDADEDDELAAEIAKLSDDEVTRLLENELKELESYA